jgi:hypothetical protein
VRRPIALLWISLPLCIPALADAGGWFNPGSGNASPGLHAIFGSGGPFEGLWESALQGDYPLTTHVEDFKMVMPDWPHVKADWANSGWTITANGSPVDHLVRVGSSSTTPQTEGGYSSLFVVSAGRASHAGVNARHDGRRRIVLGMRGTGATIFDVPKLMLAEWNGSSGYRASWGARVSCVDGADWGASYFVGFSRADPNIMVDATGEVTCGASWVTDGGIGFHLDRSGTLSLLVCRDSTLTTRSVDLSELLADGGHQISVGFAYAQTAVAGTGTLRAFYNTQWPTISTGGLLEATPWLPLGDEVTGAVFPDEDDHYYFTTEIERGTSGSPTCYMDYMASGQTKEGYLY